MNLEYFKNAKKIEYDKDDLGYYPHLRMIRLYELAEKSHKIKLMKEFSGEGACTRIYVFKNGLGK